MAEPARIASVSVPSHASGRSSGTPDTDVVYKLARLAELEAATSSLRHDLQSLMAPSLLVADRLLMSSDPKVAKAGETVVKVVIGVQQRLLATRPP